jgi:hypothetical protein
MAQITRCGGFACHVWIRIYHCDHYQLRQGKLIDHWPALILLVLSITCGAGGGGDKLWVIGREDFLMNERDCRTIANEVGIKTRPGINLQKRWEGSRPLAGARRYSP